MLEQAAKGDAEIEEQIAHGHHSSDCMAWRGLTRMARKAG